MKSIVPELQAPLRRIAEEQAEYEAVTVARVAHPAFSAPRGWNCVVMAFRPDGAELAQLLAGEDLYIGLLTFGAAQQPINLFVGREAAAAGYGIPVSERAPRADVGDDVLKQLAARAPGVAQLLTAFADAHFDCGEYDSDDVADYSSLSREATMTERALATALLALLDRAPALSDDDVGVLHAAAATIDEGPPHDPLAVAIVTLAQRLRPDLPLPAFAPTAEGSAHA